MKTITISKPTVRTRGQGIPAGVKIVRNTLALLVTMKPRWLKAAARELMGDPKVYVRDLAAGPTLKTGGDGDGGIGG